MNSDADAADAIAAGLEALARSASLAQMSVTAAHLSPGVRFRLDGQLEEFGTDDDLIVTQINDRREACDLTYCSGSDGHLIRTISVRNDDDSCPIKTLDLHEDVEVQILGPSQILYQLGYIDGMEELVSLLDEAYALFSRRMRSGLGYR